MCSGCERDCDADENDGARGVSWVGVILVPSQSHSTVAAGDRRETLNDEQLKSGADARQRLENKNVRPNANYAADQKNRKRIARHALSKGVGPNCQKAGGQRQPPEIGLRTAEQLRRLRRANNRRCKLKCR